jgi:hypothetical protein
MYCNTGKYNKNQSYSEVIQKLFKPIQSKTLLNNIESIQNRLLKTS